MKHENPTKKGPSQPVKEACMNLKNKTKQKNRTKTQKAKHREPIYNFYWPVSSTTDPLVSPDHVPVLACWNELMSS